MEWGTELIVWSIRGSMFLFVATLLLKLTMPASVGAMVWSKWLWTASFVAFVIHVLAAFHFEHHWSHAHAYRATAEQTQKLLGVTYGEGVYFNYLFMVLWGFHVCQTWVAHRITSRLIQVLAGLTLVYLLFIAFNGVVVFKSGWLRWSGLLATVILLTATLLRLCGSPPNTAGSMDSGAK